MTGSDMVYSATLSDTRALAAVAARRHGVPPTMIEAATRRRAVGDWRAACAAADVDPHVNPDSVRRRHGAAVAGRLLADLRDLAPDLLRWHLPRCGHGAGRLLEGLLVPLAEYGADDERLTLVAATPRFALNAGDRIVLTVLAGGGRPGRFDESDPVIRALLADTHVRTAERYGLVRHRMFWSAADAPGLAGLCDASADAEEITRLQDAGAAPAAWRAAGFAPAEAPGATGRWPAALPVNLPGLARRVREALPGADRAVIRNGIGAVVLSGLAAGPAAPPVRADFLSGRTAPDLPTVPAAAWSRVLDADLLRFGLLGAPDLHPLVAAALTADPGLIAVTPCAPDAWLYRDVPFIAAADPAGTDDPAGAADPAGTTDPATPTTPTTLLIRCGTAAHRVTQLDGAWQAVDHPGHRQRELLLARLGGPTNPCLQAAQHLATGRHVIDLVAGLLDHGRADDVRRVLHEHADAAAVLDRVGLPGGGTVGEALTRLRENTLRHRMVLSGAVGSPPAADRAALPFLLRTKTRRPSRKGGRARTHW